jgi:hypothetical protein
MITIPLIIALIGLIIYLATGGKPSEAGRLAFACGLLAWLFNMAGRVLY